jgi:ubiquinone/menaquinone biosynthesis C-methylase UbiE
MLKLDLGAGAEKNPGFTSVDLYDESADVRADICELPFENNSVDEIYALQVIEHIPYWKSQAMLGEMYRVLKPGATARIETPDIDIVCRKILEEGLQDKWIYNLVGEYYRPWDKERYEDWENNAASIHRNPWNYNRLYKLAKTVGFSEIEKLGGPTDKYPFEENLCVVLHKNG